MENTQKKAEAFEPKVTPQQEESIRQFKIQNSPMLFVLEMVFYLLGSIWFLIHMFK